MEKFRNGTATMTDETLRDLVTKHDSTINSLVVSVEHLVTAQAKTNEQQVETNKRLQEISKYLAKQAVFDSQLATMDRELTESFKRVHQRIDVMEAVQNSDTGCNSVKLLNKDVQSIARDVIRLIGTVEDEKLKVDAVDKAVKTYPSAGTIKWLIGGILVYLVSFGTYVVQSIQALNETDIRVTTMLKHSGLSE